MTIKLTGGNFREQFQAADEEELRWDAADELDIVRKFDTRIAQGWWRTVWLREGISLAINKAQHSDQVIVSWSEQRLRNVHCCFPVVGKLQSAIDFAQSEIILPYVAGKYSLRGSGLCPQTTCDCSGLEPYSELQLEISTEVLCSLAGSLEGGLSKNIQHLIRDSSQEVYLRFGDSQPRMSAILQQILHCPYQGLVKRMYLESKVIELMALVLDHEVTIQQGEIKKSSLKPEQIERIYYAREILFQDLTDPPSLTDLAHQVGLNDFLLKQGFRQVFGTTVFGELRSHRLNVAKQLLAEQDVSIAEIAHRVGYASLNSFSKAFSREFGLRPKIYQKACR